MNINEFNFNTLLAAVGENIHVVVGTSDVISVSQTITVITTTYAPFTGIFLNGLHSRFRKTIEMPQRSVFTQATILARIRCSTATCFNRTTLLTLLVIRLKAKNDIKAKNDTMKCIYYLHCLRKEVKPVGGRYIIEYRMLTFSKSFWKKKFIHPSALFRAKRSKSLLAEHN